MVTGVEYDATYDDRGAATCLFWSCGLIALGLSTLCTVGLSVLVVASVGLNAYLGLKTSGMEVVITIPETTLPGFAPASTEPAVLDVSSNVAVDVAAVPVPTATPTRANPPAPLPTKVPTKLVIIDTNAGPATNVELAQEFIPVATLSIAASENLAVDWEGYLRPTAEPVSTAVEGIPAAFVIETEHPYALIPVDGALDFTFAADNGDLNLKLRLPERIEADPYLVDTPGVGADPDPPQLSSIFEPTFLGIYTIHHWDWACTCRGALLKDDPVALVGIETEPGQPLYIPPRRQAIFGDDVYAVLLFASEDTVTFAYNREGSVATGYAVHYQGLYVDPALLAAYQNRTDKALPGLSLDTRLGTATDELIVAVRDNGTFLDARSRKDFWR